MKDLERTLGLGVAEKDPQDEKDKLHLYINLKLASSGQPTSVTGAYSGFFDTTHDLLRSYREKNRLLSSYRCPVDQRIESFLSSYFGMEADLKLPANSFVLDRHGVARELSLPVDGDSFHSSLISSFRVKQGVLHNPASDRRTTKGSFHIVEDGLPIPGDKKTVPKLTFTRMFKYAMNPPKDLLTLPFSINQKETAQMFVSLLLRPTVCPEIPGVDTEKSMEIRFFAPGNLVSNLDFVESIFGNGGNPNIPRFDAALDVDHWTGHTGCVILAPHLVTLKKKQLGLPHWDDASEQQRQEGMCWRKPNELYNDGQAFKITARDERGIIVTLLADNYFGYSKKEVKTQISYSANLFGLAEEEHSGGALAFPSRNHGEEYGVDSNTREIGYSFTEVTKRYANLMDIKPEGYGIDKQYPQLIYVPQDLRMDLNAQKISWIRDGRLQTIRLQPGKVYMQPNGYKIEMEKHPGAPSWRLVGTNPEGTFCHKPSTVSGGGKSEISKDIDDAVLFGPFFVDNLETDMDRLEEIFSYDFATRFQPGYKHEDHDPARKPLSMKRSLGSVIKLLTPSPSYTESYNLWLASIPPRLLALVGLVKRFYRPEWGNDWRQHITVDEVDGAPGHELKLSNRKMVASYLRVGFDLKGEWRTFKVRHDFIPTKKIQMEDDISASAVVPAHNVIGCRAQSDSNNSVKLVTNCEHRLFQRPDDAIIPGYDKQTELDMSEPTNFLANYEPLRDDTLSAVMEDVLTACSFTDPMRNLLQHAYEEKTGYVVSSAHPRLVDGEPSKNPRYLQTRPDYQDPARKYIAETGIRFHRKIPLDKPICHPVDAVLAGRRNNPPEDGIRPLAVYNPIHYQELPELFMDFICSLTGKSPSTTGAGSEGALTKGPFNALRPTPDLNNALVSFILTGYAGFSSSAGYIGPDMRVDHDISLLVPEIWARLTPEQQNPQFLITEGHLEKLRDFEHEGTAVLASRLGYRITDRFVHGFLGRIFDNPYAVFTEDILKPEIQDLSVFVDGINNIVEAQRRVAQQYIDDGSIDDACPPLQALLHIMAHGKYQGMSVHDASFRDMFTRESLLKSDWYKERLEIKQSRDIALWRHHVNNLEDFLNLESNADAAEQMDIRGQLENARQKLNTLQYPEYLESLIGTIGADPLKPARCMTNTRSMGREQQAA